jgi:hypothetical protein
MVVAQLRDDGLYGCCFLKGVLIQAACKHKHKPFSLDQVVGGTAAYLETHGQTNAIGSYSSMGCYSRGHAVGWRQVNKTAVGEEVDAVCSSKPAIEGAGELISHSERWEGGR